MKSSINILNRELKSLCLAHEMVNDFYWGTVPQALTKKTCQFPLVTVFQTSVPFKDNQTVYNLEINIVDKAFNDEVNKVIVESRTLDIARHIFQAINKSRKWQKLGRVESASCVYVEPTMDGASGHKMTMQFTARDFQGVCSTPFGDYDFDQIVVLPSCANGTVNILNSADGLIKSVEVGSGATEETYINDTAIIVRNSNAEIIATQISLGGAVSADVEIPDIEIAIKNSQGFVTSTEQVVINDVGEVTALDASVANSNNTYMLNAPSGVLTELPDTFYQIEVDGVNVDNFQLPTLEDSIITIELV